MSLSPLLWLAALLSCTLALTCQQGYVPNSLSICIQPRFIEGCQQYMSENHCKVCAYRYQLLPNGLCEYDKESTEECCAQRAADNSCLKCKTGLYLLEGKCTESPILGCLQKDNRGVCINCASDFYLKNGICAKSIRDCIEYTDESRLSCTACAFGHSLINNFCVANSILGCKHEVEHVCRECIRPFSLSNGNCEIPNCKGYNEYRCVTCNCGYYLTLEGLCKPMELGCIRYQRAQCTDCLPAFRLKGSQCQIEGCLEMKGLQCQKCSEDYVLSNNGCEMKNCLAWKDGSCEICKSGFNFQLGRCLPSKASSSQ